MAAESDKPRKRRGKWLIVISALLIYAGGYVVFRVSHADNKFNWTSPKHLMFPTAEAFSQWPDSKIVYIGYKDDTFNSAVMVVYIPLVYLDQKINNIQYRPIPEEAYDRFFAP